MKVFSILFAILLIGMNAPMNSASGEGMTYLGDYCWQGKSSSPEQMAATLQLGVAQLGNRHFPLYGSLSSTEGVLVLHGNAESTSSGIQVTLHGSRFGGMFRESMTFHLLLDGSLNGSYRSLGFETIGGQQPEALTDEGSLTLIECGE